MSKKLNSNQTKPATSGKWYCEWAVTPYSRAGTMITAERLQGIVSRAPCPGYRSLYWFDEHDAGAILANGHSKGLAAFVPASNVLLIDLDDGDASLPDFRAALVERGLGFEVWSSGGKGYHLVLEHEWLHDQRLPYSQRAFVESLGLPFDPCLYQAGRLISLPRRRHPKTGRRKRLLETVKGDKVNLQLVNPPKLNFNFGGGDDEGSLARGLMTASLLVTNPPSRGTRHMSIWRCSKDLLAGGLEVEAVTDILLRVSQTWPEPKPEMEVVRAVRGALCE